jgi:hypothetical protein
MELVLSGWFELFILSVTLVSIGWLLGIATRLVIRMSVDRFIQVKIEELGATADEYVKDATDRCNVMIQNTQQQCLHIYQKAVEDSKGQILVNNLPDKKNIGN